MPPMLFTFLGTLLRHVLTGLGTYLVTKGIFTNEEMEIYIGAFVAVVLGAGWSLWEKHKDRIKMKIAQALSRPVSDSELLVIAKTHTVTTPVKGEPPIIVPKPTSEEPKQ